MFEWGIRHGQIVGILRVESSQLYASVAADGSLKGAIDSTLRHIATQAGASILALASDNVGDHLVAAGKLVGPKQASLVLTIHRKGENFAKFSCELLS